MIDIRNKEIRKSLIAKYLDAETLSYDVKMQKALDFVKESSRVCSFNRCLIFKVRFGVAF